MTKRPLAVTLIAALYVATGALGLAFHLSNVQPGQPFVYEALPAAAISLVAMVCGIYMLRGRNWARWLAIAWIGFHVVLSVLHSWPQVAMHAALCVLFAHVLFRRGSAIYFRG
jgi:hypothetical protein